MDRRDFIRAGAVLGVAGTLGSRALPAWGHTTPPLRQESILQGHPGDSGVDTVVVVMMENRSFDSYLGWLAQDKAYITNGRSRYGATFKVNGARDQQYPDPATGQLVSTYLRSQTDPTNWRGCTLNDPGHGWTAGRAERDGGFLATGSGNDILALSYFNPRDLPVYRELARRFTTCDQWHASLLGPTFPNREYLLSAQSGGHKSNDSEPGGFKWETIVDRLAAANVSVAEYYSDLPVFALWGSRLLPYLRPVTNFFADAAAGKLPQVCFVDPKFVGPERTDDHPHGDPRAAQRFVRDAFAAFANSPHWQRGLFILTYDEWGGFFDHVRPPLMNDNRASSVDTENFAQCGFRVPTILCSPRSLPGSVDHTLYDHTAVLRFLEWRFLGAPPRGHRFHGKTWWLTKRDRYSANLGDSLSRTYFDPDPGFDVNVKVAEPQDPCVGQSLAPQILSQGDEDGFEDLYNSGYFDSVGAKTYVD
ncbi:MAG TPA: alkaline phosphatase family protein [Acidimicrobiia bacterium]|nr:alkaline phosphatase family protein [Acidimicrobiia bacterium]